MGLLDQWGAGWFVRSGDVVFDIGTFRGDTAALYLARGAEVHGFEPLARNRARIPPAVTDHPAFRLHPFALSDVTGTAALRVPRTNDGAGTLSEEFFQRVRDGEDDTGECHAVEVRRLDNLSLPRAKFWKIDVEGAELEMLRGAEQTLRSSPPQIVQIEIFRWPGRFQRYAETVNVLKRAFPHVWAIGSDPGGKMVVHPVDNRTISTTGFYEDLARAGTPHYYASVRTFDEWRG